LSRGIPSTLDIQQYEADSLNQRLSQPDLGYWLTQESPIARTFSTGSISQQPRPSVSYLEQNTALATSFQQPNHSHMEESLQHGHESSSESADGQPVPYEHPVYAPTQHLHLSDLNNGLTEIPSGLPWASEYEGDPMYATPYSYAPLQPYPAYMRREYLEAHYAQRATTPYSCSSVYDESPSQSSCLSSPDLYAPRYAARAPRSSPNDDFDMNADEDEEATDGKPYARLIWEALMEAPGHRMMLRDIYTWFLQNTSKPRESGGNGWQNSIRHNLSMNKVSVCSYCSFGQCSHIIRLSRTTRQFAHKTHEVSRRRLPACGTSPKTPSSMESRQPPGIARKTRPRGHLWAAIPTSEDRDQERKEVVLLRGLLVCEPWNSLAIAGGDWTQCQTLPRWTAQSVHQTTWTAHSMQRTT
jgi:hypothetical protein